MELQFCNEALRNGQQEREAMDEALQRCLHVFLLNRCIVITPFHNMLLVSPQTTVKQAEPLQAAVAKFIASVRA